MRAQHLLLLVLLGACGRAALEPHPAVVTPCSPSRIGAVHVTGADRSMIAGLAVLEGTLDDPERTQRLAEAAIDALVMRGYANARVVVTRDTGCFVDLKVAVELGSKYEIESIDFETDDAFPNNERLAVVEDALGTVNTVGGVYIEYRLARALGDLQRRYRDAGWLDAKIDTPSARFDKSSNKIAISIGVHAGARFRIGKVRARGADALARAAVIEELGKQAGAWYDGPTIRNGIERVRRRLARRVDLRTTYAADGDIVIEAEVGSK